MQFRKILSNLSLSPSAIGEASVYFRKLKSEELIRRISLIFIICILIIQFILAISIDIGTNSASVSDMLKNGYGLPDDCSEQTDIYCNENVELNIKVKNQTQGNALVSNTALSSQDYLSAELAIRNISNNEISVLPSLRVADLLEYAEISPGITHFDKVSIINNIAYWNEHTIKPDQSIIVNLNFFIKNKIPTTAKGLNFTESHDCTISLNFGNKISLPITCPFEKRIESIISKFPISNRESYLVIFSAITMISCYYYAKTRQIIRELRITRDIATKGSL